MKGNIFPTVGSVGASGRRKRPHLLIILITGSALIVLFVIFEIVIFYRSLSFHRHYDAEGSLRFVMNRVKGHLELVTFVPQAPSYLTSLYWLDDELHEHPGLYGVIIRQGEMEEINTFPPGFELKPTDFESCHRGLSKGSVYILCKSMEVLPGKNLSFVVGVDTSEQLAFFRRSILVACATGLVSLLLFYFSWRHVKRLMDDQYKLERRLSASEKLAATGKLAAMIAHEIRNPLNALSMAVQYMHETGEISPEMMDILKTETAKLKELSGELFCMHGDFASGMEIFSVTEMVADLDAKFSSKASSLGIDFFCKHPEDNVLVKGNRKWLSRAVENLIRNAFEAVPPEDGRVSLVVETAKDMVIFTVEDNGPGLSRDDESMVFEPFYSTKREGFGLGLYIVQKVAEAHGGRVTLKSRKENGAVFTMAIPIEVKDGGIV